MSPGKGHERDAERDIPTAQKRPEKAAFKKIRPFVPFEIKKRDMRIQRDKRDKRDTHSWRKAFGDTNPTSSA